MWNLLVPLNQSDLGIHFGQYDERGIFQSWLIWDIRCTIRSWPKISLQIYPREAQHENTEETLFWQVNVIQPDLTSGCQEKVRHARTELARLSRQPQSADQTPEIDQHYRCLDDERWLPCNNTAKHCSFHICSDTRRRNRRPRIDDLIWALEEENKRFGWLWRDVNTCVICLDSWLPLSSVILSGHLALRTINLVRIMVRTMMRTMMRSEDHDEDYDEDYPPCERLQTVVAPVHKVSHEDIVGVWRWAAGSDQERDMLTTNIININIIKSTKIDLKSSSRS